MGRNRQSSGREGVEVMSYNNPYPNVPSASKFCRIMECHASHQAELAAGDVPEDTRDADVGQDVHGVLSDDLSEDDVSALAAQTAEMCEEQTQRLLAEWQGEGETPIGLKELRYALVDLGFKRHVVTARPNLLGEVLFTGQYDLLYTQGKRGLLIDYKALRGDHASAIENPQLMSLAVLVAKKHGLESVRVALVQPWKGKPTVADFGAEGLALAESLLNVTLEAERNATPDDRMAGGHCKYCKARFACQTLRDANIYALDLVQPETLPANPDARNKAVFARMAEMTPQQLLHIEEYVVGLMGVFIAAHKAVFKMAVERGEIPGYTTREKKGRRSISDVGKVFTACASHGVTADAFTAECSIGLGSVKELLKSATHSKGKALDKLSDEVLTGCIEFGKGAVEIVKIGQLE